MFQIGAAGSRSSNCIAWRSRASVANWWKYVVHQAVPCIALALLSFCAGCHHDSRFEEAPQDASDVKPRPPTAIRKPTGSTFVAKSGERLPILASRARVMAPEQAAERVYPLAPGIVLEVMVRNGDVVAPGDRLVRFRSSSLRRQLADVGSGLEPWRNSSSTPRRSVRSKLQLPAAIQPDGHDDYWVRATRAGAIHQLQVTPGERIAPNDPVPILAIGDLRKIAVIGEYHATEVKGLKIQQKAVVRLRNTEMAFEGDVESISDIVSSATQTLNVRVLVDNARGLLMPGQPVDLALKPHAEAPSVVLVPVASIARHGATASVFVENEDGVLQRRIVQPGQFSETLVEIIEGLQPGERVMIQG